MNSENKEILFRNHPFRISESWWLELVRGKVTAIHLFHPEPYIKTSWKNTGSGTRSPNKNYLPTPAHLLLRKKSCTTWDAKTPGNNGMDLDGLPIKRRRISSINSMLPSCWGGVEDRVISDTIYTQTSGVKLSQTRSKLQSLQTKMGNTVALFSLTWWFLEWEKIWSWLLSHQSSFWHQAYQTRNCYIHPQKEKL